MQVNRWPQYLPRDPSCITLPDLPIQYVELAVAYLPRDVQITVIWRSADRQLDDQGRHRASNRIYYKIGLADGFVTLPSLASNSEFCVQWYALSRSSTRWHFVDRAIKAILLMSILSFTFTRIGWQLILFTCCDWRHLDRRAEFVSPAWDWRLCNGKRDHPRSLGPPGSCLTSGNTAIGGFARPDHFIDLSNRSCASGKPRPLRRTYRIARGRQQLCS